MKKSLRLIVALSLLSLGAVLAESGTTTRPGGGRSQTIALSTFTLPLDEGALYFPWQLF
jgi:hypothetical protein